MPSYRIERINQAIQLELATFIARRFAGRLITVTRVETSDDLRSAIVWYAEYPHTPEAALSFSSEIVTMKKELGQLLRKSLKMKYIPKLLFKFDHGPDHADRIERLLRSLD